MVALPDLDSKSRRAVALQDQSLGRWPDGDVAYVAFRLHAFGADETAVRTLLAYWHAVGVRRLRAYVEGIPDKDLHAHIAVADAELTRRGRRGDILRVRTPQRWPWRTSTSQPLGGAVA